MLQIHCLVLKDVRLKKKKSSSTFVHSLIELQDTPWILSLQNALFK